MSTQKTQNRHHSHIKVRIFSCNLGNRLQLQDEQTQLETIAY